MKRGIRFALNSLVSMTAGFVFCLYLVVTHEGTPTEPTVITLDLPDQPMRKVSPLSFTQLEYAMLEWFDEPLLDEGTNTKTWTDEDERQKELTCLAMNIYFEAGNQDDLGKIAVANVTINRMLHEKFPDTICDVVWQWKRHPQHGTRVAQFSWTLDGKPDKPRKNEQELWDYCFRLADAFLSEGEVAHIGDDMDGATHYHANYVNPYWSDPKHGLKMVAEVGTHKFYVDPDGDI